MSKKTHTNPLSQREIEQLRKNPYVKKAMANTVMFTEEFKRLVYEKKHGGISVSETMRSCQIDPDILGEQSQRFFLHAQQESKVRDWFYGSTQR